MSFEHLGIFAVIATVCAGIFAAGMLLAVAIGWWQ
jgi:hypothetical protein